MMVILMAEEVNNCYIILKYLVINSQIIENTINRIKIKQLYETVDQSVCPHIEWQSIQTIECRNRLQYR